MKYRTLGRTGLRVSEIGLGGHEFRRQAYVQGGRYTELDPARPEVIRQALELGVNYFDTTYTQEAQSLGAALKALGVPRGQVVINGMGIDLLRQLGERPQAQWRATIEAEVGVRLELLGCDYLDLFSICALEQGFATQPLEAALAILRDLQGQGLFHHLGASGHDPQRWAQVIEQYDAFDMLMLPFNYHTRLPEALWQAVRAHNVGLVAFKPFVWQYYGVPFMLVCRKAVAQGDLRGVTLAQMALRWVLQPPEVSTTIPAANALEELAEICRAGGLGDEAANPAVLEACHTYPGMVEEMIGLIGHPYPDLRDYALAAVKQVVGADYGTDQDRYLEAWRGRQGR
jgi:aryl-alcohol dehydrogenase-like predicted oxidoreductase